MPAKKKVAKKAAVKKMPARKVARKTKTGSPKVNLQQFLDEVKKRAYEIFLERGSAHGNDLADWIKAESEIKKQYGIK